MVDLVKKFLDDFDLFAKMLDYDKIGNLQKRWFKEIFLNKKDLVILQAHRNSYKTTTIILSIVLLLIIDPRITILVVRKSDELASQLCYEVRKNLKREEISALLSNLYKINVGKIKETQNTIDLGLTKREPSLMTVGLNKNLTGLHFSVIICDDIITEKDRYSKKEREATKRFFWELKNILKKDSTYKKIVLVGTPWHAEDLFSDLKTEILKYDIYSTKIFNSNEIELLKKSMPASLFACNYELRHINDDENYFNDLNIDEISFENKKVFMHIDTAFGGSDYTAITLCFIESNKFYVRGFCKRKNSFDLIDYFIKLTKDYNVIRLYIETNSDQGAIARELKDKVACNIIGYRETRKKHLKIIESIKKNSDRIVIDINSEQEYLNQLLNYSDFSVNDDAPDSLATLLGFLAGGEKKVFIA
ncbi:MAG: hypothetical protein GYA14_13865 [Ignavibacteria bacterium]|nr:hypothetical protein [Ignavibacteria bacterium]